MYGLKKIKDFVAMVCDAIHDVVVDGASRLAIWWKCASPMNRGRAISLGALIVALGALMFMRITIPLPGETIAERVEHELIVDGLDDSSIGEVIDNHDKYERLALIIGNHSLGIEPTHDELTEVEALIPDEELGDILDDFDKSSGDEGWGGNDNTRFKVTGYNFYLPDTYVYCLANKAGNTELITVKLGENNEILWVSVSI